jgi:predicted flap endonuclease-1-like 5' DNA nuclease
MDKFLAEDAPQRAVELYLDTLAEEERWQLGKRDLADLKEKASDLARRLQRLLTQLQALAGQNEQERILLYNLMKQLPVITFEPLNYSFVGRVVVPLENVLDLVIHLDLYTSGKPVRKGELPGQVELLDEYRVAQDTSPEEQNLTVVAGIGQVYAQALHQRAGIRTTDELLSRARDLAGQEQLSRETEIGQELIARWVHRADLMRIDGIDGEYSVLVDYAGVSTVADLAQCTPVDLYEKLRAANLEHRLVTRLPPMSEVNDWIMQAQTLT